MRGSRTTVTTTVRMTVSLAILAVGLVACSDQTGGDPNPATSTTTKSTTSSTSTGGKQSALDAIDPCGLLSASDVARFGARPGKRNDIGGAIGCGWTVPGQGTFGIALRSKQSVDSIVVGKGRIVDQSVGSHQGKRLEEPDGVGACLVSIAVSDSSRVDVDGVATHTDNAKACDFATRVAELIEPKLPKE